jgi:hypothetical protein
MAAIAPDRRQAEREDVNLDALVVAEEPRLVLDCAVRNISVFGAQIEGAWDWLPRRLYLLDVVGGVSYGAELVWRKGSRAGLRFEELMIMSEETTPAFLRQALLHHRAIELCRRAADRELAPLWKRAAP